MRAELVVELGRGPKDCTAAMQLRSALHTSSLLMAAVDILAADSHVYPGAALVVGRLATHFGAAVALTAVTAFGGCPNNTHFETSAMCEACCACVCIRPPLRVYWHSLRVFASLGYSSAVRRCGAGGAAVITACTAVGGAARLCNGGAARSAHVRRAAAHCIAARSTAVCAVSCAPPWLHYARMSGPVRA